MGKKDKIVPRETAMFYIIVYLLRIKEIKIYDGLYHEILNEKDKDKVLWDMVNWLYKKLGIGSNAYSF